MRGDGETAVQGGLRPGFGETVDHPLWTAGFAKTISVSFSSTRNVEGRGGAVAGSFPSGSAALAPTFGRRIPAFLHVDAEVKPSFGAV